MTLPEQYGIFLIHHGKRHYFSGNESIDIELCEGESVTLMQDGPMTAPWKVLAAIGIFLTAPFQIAYQFYGGRARWDCVIPFRITAMLQVAGKTACHITVTEGETQFQRPRFEVSGSHVSVVAYRCDKSPLVFRDACFVFLCRIIGAELWVLALTGYLLAVSIAEKNVLGMLATCAACLAAHAARICKEKVEKLNRTDI